MQCCRREEEFAATFQVLLVLLKQPDLCVLCPTIEAAAVATLSAAAVAATAAAAAAAGFCV
jgi:hypothetical protein